MKTDKTYMSDEWNYMISHTSNILLLDESIKQMGNKIQGLVVDLGIPGGGRALGAKRISVVYSRLY